MSGRADLSIKLKLIEKYLQKYFPDASITGGIYDEVSNAYFTIDDADAPRYVRFTDEFLTDTGDIFRDLERRGIDQQIRKVESPNALWVWRGDRLTVQPKENHST